MTAAKGRRSAAAASMRLSEHEAFITADLATIRYLTGFSGSSAVLALCPHGDVLVSDRRYAEQIDAEVHGVDVVLDRNAIGALAQALTVNRVLADRSLAIRAFAELQKSFALVEIGPDVVADMRAVKDADEIESLTQACDITSRALTELADTLRVGETEIEIARRLESLFGQLGAQDRAFPTIVAAGENSAIPHHRPTRRPLCLGDLLVIDCGAKVDGYHADMTRTFIVGSDPDPWQREIYEITAQSQLATLTRIVPGIAIADVDRIAREVITGAGFGSEFSHGTGHGVGLEIHEQPMIVAAAAGTLSSAMVITVEPGVYLPGRGGVRIEDTVLVHETATTLTHAARELTRVG